MTVGTKTRFRNEIHLNPNVSTSLLIDSMLHHHKTNQNISQLHIDYKSTPKHKTGKHHSHRQNRYSDYASEKPAAPSLLQPG